jgi:hypothetical protein
MSKHKRYKNRPAPPPPTGAAGARVWRFLGSPAHLVGTLFAIFAILLLDGGLTGGAVGVALIPLMYVTGFAVVARRRFVGAAIGPFAAKDAPRVRAQLDEMIATIRMRVSDDVYRRVVMIRDAIVFTLDRAGEESEADPNVYLVRQTARTYLPEALAAYLALPRDYAERQPVEGGMTSHDLLLQQLYLMDLKTRQVAEYVLQRDSRQLVKHGRFVADRLAPSSLEVPDDAPIGAPLPGAGTLDRPPKSPRLN